MRDLRDGGVVKPTFATTLAALLVAGGAHAQDAPVTPSAEPVAPPSTPTTTPPVVPPTPVAPVDPEKTPGAGDVATQEKSATTSAPPVLKSRGDAPALTEELWGSTLRVEPHIAVYAEYVVSLRSEGEETSWFHTFELPRAHASLLASFDIAEAKVLVEGVRSASEGALLGVGGDSIVLRLREAWGGFTAWKHLEVRFGLVPTLTIPVFEDFLHLRPLAASAIERVGFGSPADLGVTARGIFPGGYGFVATAFYNGEGYRQRELNRGKNLEVAAEFHPLAAVADAAPLTLFGSYVSGSTGTALGRADRIHAGIGWLGDVIRGGIGMTYALGTNEDPAASSVVGTAMLRIIPIERLVFAADAMLWQRNVDASDDLVFAGTIGGGYAFVDPILPMLAVDMFQYGDAVSLGLPARDDVRFRAVGTVTF